MPRGHFSTRERPKGGGSGVYGNLILTYLDAGEPKGHGLSQPQLWSPPPARSVSLGHTLSSSKEAALGNSNALG